MANCSSTELFAYVAITMLACVGYGAFFLVVGLFFRNPIIPALLLYGWEWLSFLLHSCRLGRLRGLDLAHRSDEGFFALFNGSFAIRLQQLADVPYEIRVSKYFGPVSSDRRAHAPFLWG